MDLSTVELVKSSVDDTCDNINQLFDGLIDEFETCLADVEDQGKNPDVERLVARVLNDVQPVKQARKQHKVLHTALSKLNKALGKEGVDTVPLEFSWDQDQEARQTLHVLVLLHFYQRGDFEAADALLVELKNTELPDLPDREGFVVMNRIASDLDGGHLTEVTKWTEAHHDELMEMGSDLPLMLHKLKFLQKIEQVQHGSSGESGKHSYREALEYARKSFDAFSETRAHEIQQLMGSIMYAGVRSLDAEKECSPYEELRETCSHERIKEMFKKDAGEILNIPQESLLATCIRAAVASAPDLLQYYKRIGNIGECLQDASELPVAVSLPRELRFHSTFICPVSREQGSKDNPPVLLTCGHVILQDSMKRMVRPHQHTPEFKCPTCPNKQTSSECLPLVVLR